MSSYLQEYIQYPVDYIYNNLNPGPPMRNYYEADVLIIMLSSLIITQYKKACGGSNIKKYLIL